MNLLKIVRLAMRHIRLILIIPFVLVVLVFLLTVNQSQKYKSNTTIYTGLASGYSIESSSNNKIDYFSANNAFDNLINIIKSRETLKETSIRLLAQHLFLKEADRSIISREHFEEIQSEFPDSLKELLLAETYDETVNNIRNQLSYGHENHIYQLLNYNHRYYSIDAISEIEVNRISSSDLINVSFESDDPGVCQQTLIIMCDVFIDNFKKIKEIETSNVVEYFKTQLKIAGEDLKQAENNLLEFNKSNNIINYYEQTRHIAEYKEDIDLYYQKERMVLVAAEASIKRTEEQINSSLKIVLKSNEILDKRKELSEVTSQIALEEVSIERSKKNGNNVVDLKQRGSEIKQDLEKYIDQLYDLKNTTEGISQKELLSKWLISVISFEESKARIIIYEEKIKDFELTYKRFAPLGATIKRIEREIDICEREYLVILKSLNDSKLKQQNIELSSDIKIIDIPFFPITAESSKRKLLLVAAGIVGLLIVVVMIFLFEYFDNTIREPNKLSENKNLEILGIYPNTNLGNQKIDLDSISDNLIETMVQNIRVQSGSEANSSGSTFVILLFSMLKGEGVTSIGYLLSDKLRNYNNKTLFINCRRDNAEILNNNDIEHDDNLIYEIEREYFKVESVKKLTEQLRTEANNYDFIFVEIPSIIGYQLPVNIVKTVDMSILFCRSNRIWSESDESALKYFKKIYKSSIHFVLNGMRIDDMEPFIGEIPKNRSKFRKALKKILSLDLSSQKSFK